MVKCSTIKEMTDLHYKPKCLGLSSYRERHSVFTVQCSTHTTLNMGTFLFHVCISFTNRHALNSSCHSNSPTICALNRIFICRSGIMHKKCCKNCTNPKMLIGIDGKSGHVNSLSSRHICKWQDIQFNRITDSVINNWRHFRLMSINALLATTSTERFQ